MTEFPCNKCGACCRNVHLAKETNHLDRGDGVCMNYDEKTRLCLIYSSRPEICRVEMAYEAHYHKKMTWSEYVNENLMVCKILESL